jgi:hypothetical protein
MDTIINQQHEDQAFPLDAGSDKSELMQIFERQVNDAYWAYKDLLRAIFENDEQAEA